MLINDTKGMYELKVDKVRNIVYENFSGKILSGEDLERMHSDYVSKVKPALKSGAWTKCSDMRNYKTSNIVEEAKKHLTWCFESGMKEGAIIVESAIVKMQMKRAAKDSGVEPNIFINEQEADTWLKSVGF